MGSKPRSVNEQARNAYLRGRYLWNERTLSGVTKSIEYYTDAIRADRNYAEAYAALSESYVTLGRMEVQTPPMRFGKPSLPPSARSSLIAT